MDVGGSQEFGGFEKKTFVFEPKNLFQPLQQCPLPVASVRTDNPS